MEKEEPRKYSSLQEIELLKPDIGRFVLFPIKYEKVWKMYKIAEASFWTAEEIKLADDVGQYNALNADEKNFLNITFAFFAVADGIVAENLAANFMKEVQAPEARCFYGFQIAIENIHAETYSKIISELLVKDPQLQAQLFNSIENYPCIKKKTEWAQNFFDSNKYNFAERIVAFAAIEAVAFSSSFCCIFWFKKQQKLPGVCLANTFISRDEKLHADFACLLYSMIPDYLKPAKSRVIEIISELVELEKLQTKESLKNDLRGMNEKLMHQYIEYVADNLIKQLGYEKYYKSSNPFGFMETIAIEGKTNFFEQPVAEYPNSRIQVNATSSNSTDNHFSQDAEGW